MLRHRPSDSHVEEEKRLRENLKSLFHNDDRDDDEEMQETCSAGFLKLKKKTHDEKVSLLQMCKYTLIMSLCQKFVIS